MIDLSVFVDKYYEMNPETNNLLFDGTKLEEGMIVLVGDPDLRDVLSEAIFNSDTFKALRNGALYNARVKNRWAMVTELAIDEETKEVSFIALYEDYVKVKRTYPVSTPWLVRLKDEDDV